MKRYRYCFVFKHTLKICTMLASIAVWVTTRSWIITGFVSLFMFIAVAKDKKSHFQAKYIRPLSKSHVPTSDDVSFIYIAILLISASIFMYVYNYNVVSDKYHKLMCLISIIMYWCASTIFTVVNYRYVLFQLYALRSLNKASKRKRNNIFLAILCIVYSFLIFAIIFRKPIHIYDFSLIYAITWLFSLSIFKIAPLHNAYTKYVNIK